MENESDALKKQLKEQVDKFNDEVAKGFETNSVHPSSNLIDQILPSQESEMDPPNESFKFLESEESQDPNEECNAEFLDFDIQRESCENRGSIAVKMEED